MSDISAYVPELLTSASRKKGRFTKADFVYESKPEVYRCPAGARAIHRFTTVKHDMNLRVYWPSACPRCHPKERCSPSDYHRIRRWDLENRLEAMQRRLDRKPDAMTIRRSTAECLRYAQALDGTDTLPDQYTRASEYEDEPSGIGL